MERLLLVRHGQSLWNAEKTLQGQADIGLSERGRAQARALAPMLARWQPEGVVCSDLQRARQTAQLMGYATAALDARWREADLGDWTGRRADELIAEDSARYQRWRDGEQAPPGGESMAEFRARIAAAIDVLRPWPGTVLVITHGGVIRAALSVLLGLPADRIVAVDPGSLTAFQMQPTARLLAYNHSTAALETQTTD
jgi:glucosyl-3-phosphoglycerate phosphatase